MRVCARSHKLPYVPDKLYTNFLNFAMVFEQEHKDMNAGHRD
jgi:hypothetical protein